MEIVIGRKGNQSFTITDGTVSSRHLKLTTLADGNVLVEDLGSANGTFINGVQIIKKTVSRDTVVRMGPNYTFCIKDVVSETNQQSKPAPDPGPAPAPKPGPGPERDPGLSEREIIQRFNRLEDVWKQYQKKKIELQKDNASKNFLRMMPMVILGALGYAVSCFPALADYRFAITVAGILLGAIITWISYKSATSLPEQMEKLNQQFQIDYVCPKCKRFLGFIPFDGLKNMGQCSACKSKWV